MVQRGFNTQITSQKRGKAARHSSVLDSCPRSSEIALGLRYTVASLRSLHREVPTDRAGVAEPQWHQGMVQSCNSLQYSRS
jgi:hypothetical protein